jgi:queuine/archaeosine tRNA-ribosyltransferase
MQRTDEITFGKATVLLPSFYPSVSSVKTNLGPADYVQLLTGLRFPQFLFSAYDYQHADEAERHRLDGYFGQARDQGVVMLLDSGNYESFWLRDTRWSAMSFHDVCRTVRPPMAFSFDDQYPPDTAEGAGNVAVERARSDTEAVLGQVIIPIVHSRPGLLPSTVANVVRALRPPMVAVAERELGNGIAERCRSIAVIRNQLNEVEYYCPIHVLGTGNPYSLFAFVLSGADSFDGLEWCQTVVDFSTGQLSHFQHWDLFASTSPIRTTEDLPYQQRTLAHNLVFWAELMRSIRKFVRHGISTELTDSMLTRIRPILPLHIP